MASIQDAAVPQNNQYRDAEIATVRRASEVEADGTPESAAPVASESLVRPSLVATPAESAAAYNPGAAPATPERVETVLSSADNTAAVRRLLAGYQAAYENRDAQLAKALWPAVDERALARAFEGLEAQTVTFDRCDLTVSDMRAVASCRGTATYTTRIGRRSSHTENRLWTFRLEKSAEQWLIDAVEIR